MLKNDISDTIAALATSAGEAGIGIVRLSGKNALRIADWIFISPGGGKPSGFKTYTTHYGWVINKSPRHPALPCLAGRQAAGRHATTPPVKGRQEIIDEVILTVMRAPKSYTREDVVEINCHGGIVATRAVLELVLENGARLAEPGEFTKRAFLNGRIDLAQAEAVLDIIRAKTDAALSLGLAQLRGYLSKEITALRGMLLEVVSLVEANIDFPDEEIGAAEAGSIKEGLLKINKKLKSILEGSVQGRIFREGIKVVICGRPNVGKSSLLNALLKQERSIVTPLAGTTRDVIEEVIDIKGIPVRIVDTAGLLEPRDLVEKKAVQRSKDQIKFAGLILLLFDASKNLAQEDYSLIRKLKRKNTIAIINKIDLKHKIQKKQLLGKFNCVIELSAKRLKNINLLEDAIADLVYQGKLYTPEPAMVSNLRHIRALGAAEKFIAEAGNSLDNKTPWEFVAEDLKAALSKLDDILGRSFCEDLLDKIFSDFCIGK